MIHNPLARRASEETSLIRVRVRYLAQLKQAAGTPGEAVELPAPCPVRDLLLLLAARHGEPLQKLLLAPDGSPQPTILVFVGDEQVASDGPSLKDGDDVTLLSPIAGG